MKLYRLDTKLSDGTYWVLANDPTDAETKLSTFLYKHDYGFSNDRKVTSIMPIAESVSDEAFITGKKLIL